MTNCPVLLSSAPLQPAPPLPVAGGTGWAVGGAAGPARVPSLPGSRGSWSPEARSLSPRDVLPADPEKSDSIQVQEKAVSGVPATVGGTLGCRTESWLG